MAPKTKSKFRKKAKPSKGNLAKRVEKLEIQQKADEKRTETKTIYYQSPYTVSSTWANDYGIILRSKQGTAGDGMSGGGSTPLSRIGNEVLLRGVDFAFSLNMLRDVDGTLTYPNSSTMCRILLVDNLTDTTPLSASDVLQSPTYYLTSSYKKSVSGGKRYKVLMDKRISVGKEHPDRYWKFKMPISKTGRVVHFDADTNEYPSDLRVSLLYICGDISISSGNKPLLQMFVKSRYEDC